MASSFPLSLPPPRRLFASPRSGARAGRKTVASQPILSQPWDSVAGQDTARCVTAWRDVWLRCAGLGRTNMRPIGHSRVVPWGTVALEHGRTVVRQSRRREALSLACGSVGGQRGNCRLCARQALEGAGRTRCWSHASRARRLRQVVLLLCYRTRRSVVVSKGLPLPVSVTPETAMGGSSSSMRSQNHITRNRSPEPWAGDAKSP